MHLYDELEEDLGKLHSIDKEYTSVNAFKKMCKAYTNDACYY